MTNDSPTDNLRRILVDGLRIRSGERLVDEWLRAGRLPGPVATIMVDLDSSATVRAHGIEAKIALVRDSRDRMRAVAPDGGLVVDSGTRDETYLVLPATPEAHAAAIAEALRAATADRPFVVAGIADPVALTASVGYSVVDHPASAAELFARARESLHAAKQVRNCVRTVDPAPEEVTFGVPQSVLARLARHRIDLDAAFWSGLRALDEKHGGIAYWAVERTSAATGQLPPPDLVPSANVDGADLAFFATLVQSAVFEAVLAARLAAGERFSLAVVADAPSVPDVLAARYQPGTWVVAQPLGPAGPQPVGSPFEMVQAALDRAAGIAASDPSAVRVALLPSQLAMVAKLAAKRGRSTESMLAEALQLAADRAASGTFVDSL